MAAKPAPLHTDSSSYISRIHDGVVPDIWSRVEGDTAYKIATIAIISWERIRGVDPPFPACSISHREKLIAEVEAILKVGPPVEAASTPFTDAAVAVIAEINSADRLRLDGKITEGDN